MYVFIDDERKPVNVTWTRLPDVVPCMWTIVRSYAEFVALLENRIDDITHVSFDHDLADAHYGDGLNDDEIDYSKYDEKTGFHCAQALVDWCINNKKKLPTYTVHSMNPVGSENIRGLLEGFKKFQNS